MFQLVPALKCIAAGELLMSKSENVTTEYTPAGCQLRSWGSRRKESGASSQGGCRHSAAEVQTPTEGLWEVTAVDASVTSGNASALLCVLPPHRTLQQREQRLRTAMSRISVQSQCHQRTKIIHRPWGADTQPLPMTFLCRRVRQHQPRVWQKALQPFAKVWVPVSAQGAVILVGGCHADPPGFSGAREVQSTFVM